MGKSIIFCGGGTAGHVTPNLALLPYVKPYFENIHYIGTDGIEKTLLESYKYVQFHEIKAVKLVRSLNPKNLLIPFKLPASVSDCKKIIKQINPSVIFSKGGYAALPVVLASKNVPVISHESDYSPGLANKIAAKHSKIVCTSFFDTAKQIKNGLHTGSPIRGEIYSGTRCLDVQFDASKPVLLVMGGSLGAGALNDAVFNNIDALKREFNIIHITGKGKNKLSKTLGYYPVEYTTRIQDCFAYASVALTRGGANSLFELAALKIPALIVPLYKSSRGDQLLNARYFESLGTAKILQEPELSDAAKVIDTLKSMAGPSSVQRALESIENIDGTKRIAALIREYALA